MRITVPEEVMPANLLGSNVPEDDYPIWVAGSYTTGQRVIYERQVYAATGSTTSRPDQGAVASPPTWSLVGYSNRWRMFTEGVDSLTTQAGTIEVDIQPENLVTDIAVLGVTANSVQVVVTDASEGVVYNKTLQMVDASAGDWFDWHFASYDIEDAAVFSDLPPYVGATIKVIAISLDGLAEVSVGRVALGEARELGLALFGTSMGLIDFSSKERDGFGNLTLVPRRVVDRLEFQVVFETSQLGFIRKSLRAVASKPVLFTGADEYSFTTIFAVFRDFRTNIDGPEVSYGSIEVEGF